METDGENRDRAGWRNRSVFITGANGFIGSWLAAALCDAGARVVALVRDTVPDGGLHLHGLEGRVTRIPGDLLDLPLLHRVLAEHEVTLCFHLAAQAIVGVADRSPVGTFASNVMGTVNLLEACRQSRVGAFVLASSDKAYGSSQHLPYREDMPLLGLAPYEATKVCAEAAARSYAATFGLQVVVARCANVYGGGDLNFSRLVPDTIRSILEDRNPVLRSDGSPRRDYIYAADAAAAYMILGLHSLQRVEAGRLEAYNFGSGEPVSVLELVQTIIDLSGRSDLQPDIQGAGRASREIQDQYLDSTLARERLGWAPRVPLREGLAAALDWYRGYLLGSAQTALPVGSL
jgi:CDP-glucose 4,6-dehydratase